MATITTRVQGDSPKGSPLTNAEVDNNFINLNTAKYESGDNVSFGTGAFSGGVPTGGAVVDHVQVGSTSGSGLKISTTSVFESDDIVFFDAPATQTGQLVFQTQGASRFNISSTEVYFNHASTDTDFRVESDTQSHMLFVDAGNDAVGIGGVPITSSQLTAVAAADTNIVLKSNDNYMTLVQDAAWNSVILGGAYWSGQAKHGVTGRSVTRLYLGHDSNATPTSQGLLVHASAQGTVNANVTFEHLFSTTRAGTFFNDDGLDRDFRVESATNTHALFVDAENSRVGINSDASTSGAALQVAGGALQVSGHGQMPSWGIYQAAYSYWIKIYEREFQTPNSFGHHGIILDLVGSGSTAGNTHFGRVVINTKQQQAEDGYTITIPEAVGIQFAARFDETGGSNSTGELSVWARATENYVSLSMWAKHQYPNYPADANWSTGTIMMQTTNSETIPTGAIELEPVSHPVGVYYDDGGGNNAVRGINGYSENYKTYVSRLISNGGAVINENGVNSDFRVESTGNTHAIFVDGGANRASIFSDVLNADGLTIGTTNGNCELDLSHTGTNGKRWRLNSTSVGALYIQNKTDGYNPLVILANQNVGIQNTNPYQALGVGGAIEAGDGTGTDGSVVLRQRYNGATNDYIGNWGTEYSSGAPFMSYGLRQSDSETGWKATYDNFTGDKGVLRVGAQMTFFAAESGDNTAVGSEVTVYNYFTTGRLGTVVNEDGRNEDFRVESDTNANMLFVDASTNRVAIGTNSPDRTFDARETNANTYPTLEGSTRPTGIINVRNAQGGVGGPYALTEYFVDAYGTNWFSGVVSTNTSYGGYFTVSSRAGSSLFRESLRMYNNANGAVFNEGGVNMDFRVESDTNTNALFVDAGNSRVGVNNSGPSFQLQVGATNSANMGIGWQRTETFAVDIPSSGTRWYKLANYTTNILQGQLYMTAARGGGANQTNGGRIQHGTISGYNNTVQDRWGDLGTNYGHTNYYVEIGTDTHVYLRVNGSIYGGSIFCVFQGRANWVFDGTFVTSAP